VTALPTTTSSTPHPRAIGRSAAAPSPQPQRPQLPAARHLAVGPGVGWAADIGQLSCHHGSWPSREHGAPSTWSTTRSQVPGHWVLG
jgi:hypothetical protein